MCSKKFWDIRGFSMNPQMQGTTAAPMKSTRKTKTKMVFITTKNDWRLINWNTTKNKNKKQSITDTMEPYLNLEKL